MTGEPTTEYGRVIRNEQGRDLCFFERRLTHSVERVWLAIVEPSQRRFWAPGIHFEPKKGGRYRIWFGEDCEGPAHVEGQVEAFDPPRLLQIGSIRFELEPEGEGRCLLKFSDILWYDGKRTKTDFANSVLGGWHRFLDRFEFFVDHGRRLEVDEPDYAKVEVPGRP